MPVRQKDAQRALELLQEYRAKLDQRQQSQSHTKHEDRQLQHSLDRVIDVFQSQLFSALLDIQEYYELTILEGNKCSVDQTDLPAPCGLPAGPSAQSQPSSDPLGPQASGGPSQQNLPAPRPKSIESPAPSIPPTTKPSSPMSQPITAQSQEAKVKHHAPLPPAQLGASKILPPESPKSSSPSVSTSPGFTVNGAENPAGSIITPPGVSLNGAKQLSAESSATSPSPQSSSVSPDLHLVTVSALVSSTVQGLVSPTTPDKLTPISSGPSRGTEATITSTAPVTSKDPGVGKITPSTSPAGPNQAKFTFSSRSPTVPPGPLTKGPHLSPISPGPIKVTPTSPSRGPASPRPAPSPLTPNKIACRMP